MEHNFSLLSEPWSSPPRDLAIALAQEMAKAKPYGARMELLNRIYGDLSWRAQARCRAELVRCKQAQRGLLEAVVA